MAHLPGIAAGDVHQDVLLEQGIVTIFFFTLFSCLELTETYEIIFSFVFLLI